MWPRCAFTNMPSAMQNRNTVVSRFGVSVSNFMVYFIGFILMCLIVSLHFLSLPFSSLFCVHLCFTCSFEICTFKSVFFPHSLSVYLFCSPCHCLRASCFLPFSLAILHVFTDLHPDLFFHFSFASPTHLLLSVLLPAFYCLPLVFVESASC